MIKKLGLKIKEYGLITVGIYILKKILKKIEYKILKNKLKKGKLKLEFDELEGFHSSMKFYFANTEKEKIKKFYKKNLKLKNEILEDAQKILEHKFDLLGSGETFLGEKINWNQDFKSGFIWKNNFYKEILTVNLNNDADVKVPWELSRFQHLFTLGKAYWITEDKKYYEEFRKQVLDWIENNPIYMTVNWTCAMDVAIRALNWIFGYFLFENLVKNDKEFLKKLNNSLFWHGKYIYGNLEKDVGLNNNHYLSDLNGLIFLGLYFKSSLKNKETLKWLNYSIKELEKEMFIENNEDGSNYETSTSYHRLVTELMFFPMVLLEKNEYKISKYYKDRLEKMFEFMAKLTKENGKVPLIGDVDNGRLVILSYYYNWEVSDFRHLISLGGEYYNNLLLKSVASKEIEDKLWIFSSEEEILEEYYKKPCEFKNGGYYLLQNENIYCLIRCGELSLKGQGGHSHNDQLSIELNIKGEDFFIDPGTGVYTANKDIRNLFRSTKIHNTVYIKDFEQNSFNENNLFEMKEESFARCLKFSNNKFEGEHFGYVDKTGDTHKRKIVLKNNSLEIEDYLNNSDGIISFILEPEVKIYENSNALILEKNKIKVLLKSESKKWKVLESLVSKKYGGIQKTKRIEININSRNKVVVIEEE
ncbi:alginate lyase family protein [Fusobacterium sp. THCT1E2]